MDQSKSGGLRSHGSGNASSRPGSGTPGSPEKQPVLADRGGGEVVVKIDGNGNGNGHAPFSFHGKADAGGGSGGGGAKAGNATSGTNSTATTPRTESRPRSSETTSPRSPPKVWREGSYEFWNNDGGGGAAGAPEAFSFKNRPPQAPQATSPSMSPQQPPPPPEGAGGVDPPTRLIGSFLRKQAASGGEVSLDLDLEMEELGRSAQLRSHPSFSSSLERDGRVSLQEPKKRRSASSGSSDSDTDDGRKRRGDDGEVVRCTSSSTAAGAGPLLRIKTRSRLMDPPPQSQPAPAPASAPAAAPSPVIDEKKSGPRTPTKSGRFFSGLMSGNKSGPIGGKSGPIEEEEDDPFVDDDIPDDFKRGKLDALTVLQWLGLFLIIAALACSLSIKILSAKIVLGLHLWKWELLVFVLICGRLVSGWVIRIAVFGVERNFLLRKRVLYFVYGVRSAVQNALWLGLVLASWHFLFDKNVQQETNSQVLPYVTKILFCFLVATLIRLVKKLLLKVLASSFHVSTYFDRIQEALFNQYVIETLSGPPLVDENHVLQEVRELQRAGATIPKELRDAVPTKTMSGQRNIQLSGVMPKGEGSKQLSKDKGEGISIDALHKLNQKNISAWNMKRLMRIVRFGTLTTMDEQIQQATGQGDESATQIRSEYEAKIAAKKIFHNVAKPCSKYIYLSDLMRFMRQEEAVKAMNLFEGAQEHNRVSKRSLKNWVVNAFRERKALALTLNDTKTAVNKLNQMANVVVGIIVFALCLLILGIATTHFFVFLSSQLLLAVFVFGNTLKTVFEAIVFLFVMHPFDVGDRCEIEGVQMVVEEMNIMTTVFLRYDNLKIYYPNSVLATKPPRLSFSPTSNPMRRTATPRRRTRESSATAVGESASARRSVAVEGGPVCASAPRVGKMPKRIRKKKVCKSRKKTRKLWLYSDFEEKFGSLSSSSQDTLSKEVVSNLSEAVVALASFNGDRIHAVCSGIVVKTDECGTSILTSAGLVRSLDIDDGCKYFPGLVIEVSLPNDRSARGCLWYCDLNYNVAVVNISYYPGFRAAHIDDRMEFGSDSTVVALGRCFKTDKLKAFYGIVTDDPSQVLRKHLMLSTCKINVIMNGGPLVDLDGNFVGMNFYSSDKNITPFLPVGKIYFCLVQAAIIRVKIEHGGDSTTERGPCEIQERLMPNVEDISCGERDKNQELSISSSYSEGTSCGESDKNQELSISSSYSEDFEEEKLWQDELDSNPLPVDDFTELVRNDLKSHSYPMPIRFEGGMRLINTFEEEFVEDTWSKLSKKVASDISRSVVSLASFKGEERLFACTGIFIDRDVSTSIVLTSASLFRTSAVEDKIADNLRIKVKLPNKQVAEGILQHYNLSYNIAVVSVKGFRCLRNANLDNQRQIEPHMEVVAVGCIFESGKLMATSGIVVDKESNLDCKQLMISTCKVTKAGIGGPLIDFDGNFIGMNFHGTKETHYLPRSMVQELVSHFKESVDDRVSSKNPNRWPVPNPRWSYRSMRPPFPLSDSPRLDFKYRNAS